MGFVRLVAQAFRLGPRRLFQALVVARSGEFDAAFYRRSYPDTASFPGPLLLHYLAAGAREGRDPNPGFSTAFYLAQNPDVVRGGLNPLYHYVRFGRREGRTASCPVASTTRPAWRVGSSGPEVWSRRDTGSIEGLGMNPLRPTLVGPPRLEQPGPGAASASGASRERVVRLVEIGPSGTPKGDRRVPLFMVSHLLPWPPRAGNEYRNLRLLRWLRREGYRVVPIVAPLAEAAIDVEDGVRRLQAEVEEFVLVLQDGTIAVRLEGSDALRTLEGRPVAALAPARARPGPTASRQVETLIADFCPPHAAAAAVVLEAAFPGCAFLVAYALMARLVRALAPGTLCVVDTFDVLSTKAEKVERFGPCDGIAMGEQDERTLLAAADVVLAIQAGESEALRRLVPGTPVLLTGIDFDVSLVAPPPRAGSLLVVGSDNRMNVRALGDFLALCWPLVARQYPGATLTVAGSLARAVNHPDPRVHPLGVRDSLDGLYGEATVVLNPVVAGTGIKVKTLEALSRLRPVVCWPAGVEGLPDDLATLCRVARSWPGFAAAIGEALAAPEGGFSSAERRARAEGHLAARVVYGSLAAELGSRFPRGRSQGA